jgi:hypothetical protein
MQGLRKQLKRHSNPIKVSNPIPIKQIYIYTNLYNHKPKAQIELKKK